MTRETSCSDMATGWQSEYRVTSGFNQGLPIPHHSMKVYKLPRLRLQGTGLRAGVHIKLPHLGKHEKFSEVLKQLRHRWCGHRSVGGVCDVSNADCLGFSEVELAQMVVDDMKLLTEMEQRLKQGQAVDDLTLAQPGPRHHQPAAS